MTQVKTIVSPVEELDTKINQFLDENSDDRLIGIQTLFYNPAPYNTIGVLITYNKVKPRARDNRGVAAHHFDR